MAISINETTSIAATIAMMIGNVGWKAAASVMVRLLCASVLTSSTLARTDSLQTATPGGVYDVECSDLAGGEHSANRLGAAVVRQLERDHGTRRLPPDRRGERDHDRGETVQETYLDRRSARRSIERGAEVEPRHALAPGKRRRERRVLAASV